MSQKLRIGIILLCALFVLNSCGFNRKDALENNEPTTSSQEDKGFTNKPLKPSQESYVLEQEKSSTEQESQMEQALEIDENIDIEEKPKSKANSKSIGISKNARKKSSNPKSKQSSKVMNNDELSIAQMLEENPETDKGVESKEEAKPEEILAPEEEVKSEGIPILEEEPEENSEDTDIPKIMEKPAKKVKKGGSYRPSKGSSETNLPHIHLWQKWQFKDEQTEERTCSECGITETQKHVAEETNKKYEYCQDDSHNINTTYYCANCENTYTNTTQENCDYGEWQYTEGELETRYCTKCKHAQNREHHDEVKPEEPHNHTWGKWVFKDEQTEERTCSECEFTETQSHAFEVTNEEYEDCLDGNHNIATTHYCANCENTYTNTTQEKCEYSEWQYTEDNLETRYCIKCKHAQKRKHQHEEPPAEEELEYICTSSNKNGTHVLEASYTCSICEQSITVSKNEDCSYEVSYEKTGVNDIHNKISICDVCNNRIVKEEQCKPTGELKLVKVYAQIYEYYDCELCGDWCKRSYHTVHKFQDWEQRDDNTHIRYCICVEGRETAEHKFEYVTTEDSSIFTCTECGFSKTTKKHEHGYDTCNEMDLMKLIFSPAYNELKSKSQIANPNPSPTKYCSRYDFRCQVCGIDYHIYYAHSFVDGVCTRTGYCGGISQSNTDVEEEENSFEAEPVENKQDTDVEEEENSSEAKPVENKQDTDVEEEENSSEAEPVENKQDTDVEEEESSSEAEPVENKQDTDVTEEENSSEAEPVESKQDTDVTEENSSEAGDVEGSSPNNALDDGNSSSMDKNTDTPSLKKEDEDDSQ